MIPKLVGILNVTPDSFSDGGLYLDPSDAIARAKELVHEGASIVDIGAQSTAPNSKQIDVLEEIERLKPIIHEVAKFIPVSVDTYRAKVAEFAIQAGASFVNDVSAGSDPDMFAVVASYKTKYVIMHSLLTQMHDFTLGTSRAELDPLDPVPTIVNFFHEKIDLASQSGVQKEQIVLDPGMGAFIGSNPEVSWAVIKYFKRFEELGFPLMLAGSRKGFLRQSEERDVSDRDLSSAMVAAHVTQQFDHKGPSYIRVHNPKLHRHVLGLSLKLCL